MTQFRTHFRAMGGDNEIVVATERGDVAEAALEAAVAEVLRIEHKYSRYRQDSLVNEINQAAGSGVFVTCDPETLHLLEIAGLLYRESGGLFDITSGVLRNAWNFAVPSVPSPEALAPFLALIGWSGVDRRGDGVRLTKAGMEIDFGGFGKEYASDQAASKLLERGIMHGYVNLGGDMRAVGPQPDGSPWLVGVQHPRARETIVATIPLESGALATSGDYQKYFEIDGRIYCHILNPRTGFPVDCWASVSVRAPSSVFAGALSTIAMLKEENAIEFLRTTKCAYLAVDREGRPHTSGT